MWGPRMPASALYPPALLFFNNRNSASTGLERKRKLMALHNLKAPWPSLSHIDGFRASWLSSELGLFPSSTLGSAFMWVSLRVRWAASHWWTPSP